MFSDLAELIQPERVLFDELMSRHTTFGIGGPVDALVLPNGINDIIKTLNYCKERQVPCTIFGLGSNLLVRDRGIRGVAIKLGNSLTNINVSGTCIEAEAGVSLRELAHKAAQNSLTGLEFAEGIPGSLGGAVVMNAGAYGGEIGDRLCSATVLGSDGNLQTYYKDDMNLGYRSTIFQRLNAVIVSAQLSLEQGDGEFIFQKMDEYAKQRRSKQPLDMPSAGSTFRRPEGFYVGPLIEKLGLKGFSIGGAEVSNKHAGFIVNKGNASAQDVLSLIAHIQNQAWKHFGVELHTEIKIVGEE